MPHFLQAGPVRVRYENGFVRQLTLGNEEVLRMIYFAVRDHNWVTIVPIISNEIVEETTTTFRIRYDWQTNESTVQIAGQVDIQGNSDGTIAVDFYGKALDSFRKNRIGLCILHPIDGVLGQPAEITEPDGSLTNSHFSTLIAPHQPFLNIQTMRWQPASGLTLQLDFSGDVFETEDQRNWTDASFKTYSTPLVQPFPVDVLVGDEFRQKVVFHLSERKLSSQTTNREFSLKAVGRQTISVAPKPLVGVGQRADGKPLMVSEATLLQKLNLSHLRADIFFSLPDWQMRLNNALADAQLLTVPLELALFFGQDSTVELHDLNRFLQNRAVTVRSMLLFNAETLTTSTELLQTVVPALRATWPNLLIGGGTDDNFAQLNRDRFNYESVDFVTYSINPQVHAFDDLTMLENIAGQTDTVLSAKELSGGKPVHISPVTLLPRFTTLAETATERQTAPADPRQTTEFGAEWTRQSLSALTNAGVASITYYQSHGLAGLVDGNTTYPLYSVFK